MAVTWKELCSGGFSHGNSTGTGSSQTIAHGLGAAPNFVSIVPTETGLDELTFYADATNIYVTATSGIDYNWSAGMIQ